MDRRIRRLVAVIATSEDAPDALVARLHDLEGRRRLLAADVARLRPVPRLPAAGTKGIRPEDTLHAD